MAAADCVGAAKRRRDRQLRAFRRHELLTVRMELAAALHHSAQRVEAPREVEEHETNVGLRAQMPPRPGTRPAALREPGLVVEHAARPCSSWVPSLSRRRLSVATALWTAPRCLFSSVWRWNRRRSWTGERGERRRRRRRRRSSPRSSFWISSGPRLCVSWSRGWTLVALLPRGRGGGGRLGPPLALFVAVVDSSSVLRAMLVSLVTFLFALCSLRFLAGS